MKSSFNRPLWGLNLFQEHSGKHRDKLNSCLSSLEEEKVSAEAFFWVID
jgi:hypothetical protein